jgi:hypothetical protein
MRNNVKGCRMVGVGDYNRGAGINSVQKSEMGGRGAGGWYRIQMGVGG